MPPHAYFRFPESSPQHPVDAPLWRLPDMYATAIIPAQVIGLPQPTQLICAVVFPMTDFVAPAQGLMDIDPHNRAALGRLRLLLALLKLKNEPWRASTSATNRTTTFAPTAAQGMLVSDESALHQRIRCWVEQLVPRDEGPMSAEELETELQDRDMDKIEFKGNLQDYEDLFEAAQDRETVLETMDWERVNPTGAETIGVRYVFAIQDPTCSWARGFANLKHANSASTNDLTGKSAAASRAERLAKSTAGYASRNAKRVKRDNPNGGGGADSSSGNGGGGGDAAAAAGADGDGEETAYGPAFAPADMFCGRVYPWEGHRAFTSHRAYLEELHGYNAVAALGALAENEATLDVYSDKTGMPINPSHPCRAMSLWYAVREFPAADGMWRRLGAAQRYMCNYLTLTRAPGIDPTTQKPYDIYLDLKFPLPTRAWELTGTNALQACVWGCAFPWVPPAVPQFPASYTEEQCRRGTEIKLLHLEEELVRKLARDADSGSGAGGAGGSDCGVCTEYEAYCADLQERIAELPTPQAQRAYRHRPSVLDHASMQLSQKADPHVRSMMEWLYDKDRKAKARGKGGYSLFGDEMGGRGVKDPAFEPIANFVLRVMDDLEHYYHTITHHAAVFKVYIAWLGAFEPRRTMKFNVVLHGTAGTSKSFAMKIVTDRMACGSAVLEATSFSSQAFNNDSNLNYSFIVMDEINEKMAGIGKGGTRDGEGDAMWKTWLTSQTIKGYRTMQTESGEYVGKHTDKEMIGSMVCGMNFLPRQLAESIQDRFYFQEIVDLDRPGHNYLDKEQFEMLSSSWRVARASGNTEQLDEVDELYQKISVVTCIAYQLIKQGLLVEPNMLVATMGIARQLDELKRGGAAGAFHKKRNPLRTRCFAVNLTMVKAIVEVFCNRATCPLSPSEWEKRSKETFHIRDFLLLQAHLNSNDQIAALAFTATINQWVEPMQAYPLQQLFEHGNGGHIAYRDWVRRHTPDTLERHIPGDSGLQWVTPHSQEADAAGSYMYARFGPIMKTNSVHKTMWGHAAEYIARLMAQTGSLAMGVSAVQGVLLELSKTPYDAPVYDSVTRNRDADLETHKPKTRPMPIARFDAANDYLEVLECYVRASYTDAHQNATRRAVSGLQYTHTRARPLLTATQIMHSRGIIVDGESLILPQFLEVVNVEPKPDRAWVVSNATKARTAITFEDDEFDETGNEAALRSSDELSLIADCDVELSELIKYLHRCGFSREENAEEYARALRAHSLCTVADTLKFQSREHPSLKRFASCYPEAYLNRYVQDEIIRRKNKRGGAGTLQNAVTFTEYMRRNEFDVDAMRLGGLAHDRVASEMLERAAKRTRRIDGCAAIDAASAAAAAAAARQAPASSAHARKAQKRAAAPVKAAPEAVDIDEDDDDDDEGGGLSLRAAARREREAAATAAAASSTEAHAASASAGGHAKRRRRFAVHHDDMDDVDAPAEEDDGGDALEET